MMSMSDGLTTKTGKTVKVTGTLTGELKALAERIVIVAWYVPIGRLAALTDAVNVEGAEALAGLTVSQGASALASQFNVLAPMFSMLTV